MKEIKRKVRRFRREYNIRTCTLPALTQAFEKQGFTIIWFNPVLNDKDVETVVHALGLEERIARSNGFIYIDRNYRLLFVNESLTDQEKILVMAHEEGHYYCGHKSGNKAISVVEEYEANEFAHYLLYVNPLSRHKKYIAVGAVAAVLAVGGFKGAQEYHDRQLYEGEFYVTAHGAKYHRESCVTIQGHEIRRLTKEDVGKYEPCSVCQPDK